jgi:hypothetical protein
MTALDSGWLDAPGWATGMGDSPHTAIGWPMA